MTQRDRDTIQKKLSGEIHFDDTLRRLYATDASVYRQLPLAVAFPKDSNDIKHLIAFAYRHQSSLIPRAAGTSLAGQCVGTGVVVDVSRYMTDIIELNVAERWVRLQPGVVRDDLNRYLGPYGLFFGPNTSTANRAMIGGMVGNNSCGSYSLVYGDTRRHVIALQTILSNGDEVRFAPMSREAFRAKCIGNKLENQIYRQLNFELSNPEKRREIIAQFPKPTVSRRNTGYALDELLQSNAFQPDGDDFNMCQLLAGSEGTLAFITEITLHLDPLPPPHQVLVCGHFDSINQSLHATVAAMPHQPRAVELMDKIILDCTKENREQQKNRFFVQGSPAAVLCVEFANDDLATAQQQAQDLINTWRDLGLGYAYPIVPQAQINQVWELRSAGLGLLSNIPGDDKAVAVVEDTAVAVEDLPNYIAEFEQIMQQYGQCSVYYAHAGAGELHLRPILNLKRGEHRQLFRQIAHSSALLVKKYGGSLSGEHGDGRVRGEFIPIMVGEKNYELFRRIKKTWDEKGIFNPHKITDTLPMDTDLRYEADQSTFDPPTVFDFGKEGGLLRAAEKCNGSGDCRKSAAAGGTMCPSYMATRQERNTTRARANILREILTANHQQRAANPFDSQQIYDILDLCLSCKGCTSECPSNVDMTTLKAEFLHQYHQTHPIPLRTRLIANIGKLNGIAAVLPSLYNFFARGGVLTNWGKKYLGIAPQRSLPLLHRYTLRRWYAQHQAQLSARYPADKGEVVFFCDEFTNYNDVEAGKAAIQLLCYLGYRVLIPEHAESGRAYLSKGLLTEAQSLARQNVRTLYYEACDNRPSPLPIVGVEPSAILSFRDEYLRLATHDKAERHAAQALSQCTFMIEEFLHREAEAGRISSDQFTDMPLHILLHGHCHQKALSSVAHSAFVLGMPRHYSVEVIPSGCCGMAGSFGYEAEHYALSMQIGELVLFPAVRHAHAQTAIAAAGTSCRHQILDGTRRTALHPAEILWAASKANE
ncbi:MAG: FAD-binding protein [Chitinophagales bacterium]|nr:FAD-binding protein [Chitinophagales bacterium]